MVFRNENNTKQRFYIHHCSTGPEILTILILVTLITFMSCPMYGIVNIISKSCLFPRLLVPIGIRGTYVLHYLCNYFYQGNLLFDSFDYFFYCFFLNGHWTLSFNGNWSDSPDAPCISCWLPWCYHVCLVHL